MFQLPLDVWDSGILLLVSFMGSFLTAAVGVGGGAMLLVVMAGILPATALIPVHGCVQLGSNSFRCLLTRQHLKIKRVAPFIVGALLATVIGLVFIQRFESDWLPLIVGLFILWLCWGKTPKFNLVDSPVGMFSGGLITTYASLFVGASGPLVAALLGVKSADRLAYLATFSACMTVQHGLKLVLFGLVGFYYAQWMGLIIGMIAAGYLGTKAGLLVARRLPQHIFQALFKWVLTSLSVRLLWLNYGHVVEDLLTRV